MTWNSPPAAELMDVVNATWPAARQIPCGPFMLRDGQQGGKRASSATLEQPEFSDADIEQAENEMFQLDQPSLFIIRDNETALDDALETLAYRSFDFVTLFAAPTDVLAAHDKNDFSALASPEPLAAMAEIWERGDIGQARIDVMRRTNDPKCYFLGRINDAPAGAAFVSIYNQIAMVNALEVLQSARRQGLGLQMMAAAASWALEHNANTFALVVLTENKAACGLYRQLGMVEAGNYHYRIKEKI